MSTSWRRLPHQYVEGKALFLTWHLHGSLPSSQFPPPAKLLKGREFVLIDRRLDAARSGPRFLTDQRVARLVVNAIEKADAELGHYRLHAYVVMANHVHLLITPKMPPSKILQSLKGFTAWSANKILKRTGHPFWQKETYDHWVRDVSEHRKIKKYIEENPVKAGLVNMAEAYSWSSACMASLCSQKRADAEPKVG